MRRTALAGPAILFALFVALYWKLLLTSQYTWLNSYDLTFQVVPWLQFQAREWHAWSFPLWDPYQWGGQALLGQGQPGVAYPLNWVLFLAPLKHGFIRLSALNWYYVLIHISGAWFAYWCARDQRCSRSASVLAGLVFAAGGYMGYHDWPQMLNGAVWLPLALMFFLRVVRGDRPFASALLCGAANGMSFLSGHHQVPIFLTVTLGVLWVWHVARRRGDWKLLPVYGAFLFAVSAIQTVPGYEYWKLGLRWVGSKDPLAFGDIVPYSVHGEYAFEPSSILGIMFTGYHVDSAAFIGIVAITFASIAVALLFARIEVRIFLAIAIFGLLLAFGKFTGVHGILYALAPLMDKARTDHMAIVIFDVAVSMLAAIGLDAARRVVPALVPKVLGAAAVFLLLVVFTLGNTNVVPPDRMTSLSLALVTTALLAGLFAMWRTGAIRPRTAAALVIALAAIEYSESIGAAWPNKDKGWPTAEKLEQFGDIAAKLRLVGSRGRVQIDSDTIPLNFGDWFSIPEFRGYAGITKNVYEMHGGHNGQALLGVDYYVSNKQRNPSEPLFLSGANGVNIYSVADAFPPAWVVHQVESTGGAKDLSQFIDQPTAALHNKSFVRGPAPQLASCDGDTATVTYRRSQRIEIDAKLNCRGMVILSQTDYPGWVAYVDGKRTTVYEAYAFLQGVVTEAGSHKIVLVYRPILIYSCALLSATAVFIASWIAWRNRSTSLSSL